MKFHIKKNLKFFVICLLILSFNIIPVQAAKVTSFSDSFFDHDPSQLNNHTLEFTTPSGVSAGQTMVLTFQAGFNIGSVDHTDIDLEDDGTDLSLATVAAGATWGASFSGQVLTITSGTGTIAGGSVVTVEIGTHATFQVVGNEQITNPAIEDTYTISLGGTFSDSGTTLVDIADDYVNVTANVPTLGGGGPSLDPLIITNVQAINITTNSAVITWNTSLPADSYVDYGLTPGYEIGTEFIIEYVYGHGINLLGLQPDTTYHFRVRSHDINSQSAQSVDYIFTTLPLGEEPPIEEPECIINCDLVSYDLYIINPDGSERHMFTEYTQITEITDDIWQIAFEDKGEDFDYNDIIVEVDKGDCSDIRITIISFNAVWHHEIRIKVYHDIYYHDILLWPDSHTAGEIFINLDDYPSLCLTEEELTFFTLRVVPEKRLPPVGNNSTILRVILKRSGGDQTVFQAEVTTDADGYSGEIDMAGLPVGYYDFLLKGYSHLQYRKDSVFLTGENQLVDFSEANTIHVKAGDVNPGWGDNYVNGLDLSGLANHIYTADYKTDLNQDKLVNGLEFAIAVTNLWVWGDF